MTRKRMWRLCCRSIVPDGWFEVRPTVSSRMSIAVEASPTVACSMRPGPARTLAQTRSPVVPERLLRLRQALLGRAAGWCRRRHRLPIGLRHGCRAGCRRVRRANDDDGGGGGEFESARGLPFLKPPYGQITAINMDTGAFLWQVPHGETPDTVRGTIPRYGLTIPRHRQLSVRSSPAPRHCRRPAATVTSDHPRGAMLRAYDKTNGREVGSVFMSAPSQERR